MATFANPLSQFDLPLFAELQLPRQFTPTIDTFGGQQSMVDNSMLPFDPHSLAEYQPDAYTTDEYAKQQSQGPAQSFSLSAADRFAQSYGANSSSTSAASIGSSTSSVLGSPTLQQDFTQHQQQQQPHQQQPSAIWAHELDPTLDPTGLGADDIDFDELFADPKLGHLNFVGESAEISSSSTSQRRAHNVGHSVPTGLSPASTAPTEKENSRCGSVATASTVAGPETSVRASASEHTIVPHQSPSFPAHSVPSPSSSPSFSSSSFSFPFNTYSNASSAAKQQAWPGSQSFSRNITSSPRSHYVLGSPSLTASPKPATSDFQNIPRSSPKTRERQYFHTTSGRFVPPLEYSYPSLIQPVTTPLSLTPPILGNQTPSASSNIIPFPQPQPYPASPVGSPHSFRSNPHPYKSPRVTYPNAGWAPYPPARRPSVYSNTSTSRYSSESPSSEGRGGDESREKERCPFPECGRRFKDLKAHMLTHQHERPEKCPIASCEYHIKGFARKYDKNRHTLTHYKGTMVCGFCPGSGSASEKSFNRADVFKRHLTSVHGVEQNPPNSRKKASSASEDKSSMQSDDATGKCSTCGGFFKNAQAFYEHLDDCVLRIVQQEDPSEAINEKLLSSVSDDPEVQETMGRHNLQDSQPTSFAVADDEEEDEEEAENDGATGGGSSRSGKGSIKPRKDDPFSQSADPRAVISHAGNGNVSKNTPGQTSGGRANGRCGISFSKGGVALVGKSRKRRKNYPLSWGASVDKVKMKKRVVCCFDGPRRLVKDDMMLGTEFEVRMPLPGEDGRYITDLDMETLRRSEAFHGASDEERGEWFPDNVRLASDNRTIATPVLPPATP